MCNEVVKMAAKKTHSVVLLVVSLVAFVILLFTPPYPLLSGLFGALIGISAARLASGR
jgi:hypothetical protein